MAKVDGPVMEITVQDSLKNKLSEIFEQDHIFDKFTVKKSDDNKVIATGNYNNCFHLIDWKDGNNTQY